jgi:hypothetical protein
MKVIGEVDARYFSYNVETVEVTGGRFWAPYKAATHNPTPVPAASPDKNQPTALNPSLFQYRAPIDLSNPRLRKLTAALSPAYIRVSGTWRNSTYFQNNEALPMKTAPDGFTGVLTRAQWKGVVDFAHATRAEIVASVATSAGTRDANGVWTPKQAKAWLDYTRQIGGHIAATEFMNEPTFAEIGGAPKGYDAAAFSRDAKLFGSFLRQESPGTIYLGPGSVGEGIELGGPSALRPAMLATDDLMKASGPLFDAFSYHFYSTVSKRCQGKDIAGIQTLLTPAWLDRNLAVETFYAKLRDTYMPGKDLWLTESGEAACGGDTWAAQFVDSFRLLDQLGSLAQRSVKAVIYNTLASSDYGLLAEETLEPRPNYWAALLWKRTMGTRALEPGAAPIPSVRMYAQCAKQSNGAVALLLLNIGKSPASIDIPIGGERYTLSSPELQSKTVLLNGVQLKAASDGTVPETRGQAFKAGTIRFEPLTITILTLPTAHNPGCMR